MSLLLLLSSGIANQVPFCVLNTALVVSGLSGVISLAAASGSESLAASVVNAVTLAGVANAESLAGMVAGSASECD